MPSVGVVNSLRNQGTYAAGTTYYANDYVYYNGSSYVAIATTTGNLPTNTTYWSVLAAQGQPGAAGAPGAAGGGGAFWAWTGAGRVFTQPQIGMSTGTYTATSGTGFIPVRIPNGCTITSVSVYAAGAIAHTVYIGMWADTGNVTAPVGARLAYGSASIGASAGALSVPMNWTFSAAQNIWVSLSNTAASAYCLVSLGVNNFAVNGIGNLAVASASTQRWSTAFYAGTGTVPNDLTGVTLTAVSGTSYPLFFFALG